MNDNRNKPDWIATAPGENTFRSIFKWGNRNFYKNPSDGFFRVIKQELDLSDADLTAPSNSGENAVKGDYESNISIEDLKKFEKIVGKENISFDTYSRVKYSTGKSMEDILNLRHGNISDICDVVLHPERREDIREIIKICNEKRIPLHVYGGGSSVTLGLSCPKGGVTLVMSTYMNRLIEFNEVNQTITVEPGMMGPVYEDLLNNAPEKLNAERRYTGGHFPQSFEYSSVGGWIAALGSGQASSYYGDAYDLVVSQEYLTPNGSFFKTLDYPATATGPKVNDIMKGSEGCFGVLVAVTMKVFRYQPETAKRFTFMFPELKSALNAAREISQTESGMPSVFRISDPEETDIAFKMYNLNDGFLDKLLKLKGLKQGERCIFMGQTEGDKAFSKNLFKHVKKISKQNKGLYLTGYPMGKWYKGRFSDPYMRDALNDFGVLIDTLEASVTWDNLENLYFAVRNYIKKQSNTICMTHASHFYAQGTNLYFIFISRMQDIKTFRDFQRGIIKKINENKGSLSHHHGIGRMMAPLMEEHLGKEQMDILRAVKNHCDPNGIMNPGGLGL